MKNNYPIKYALIPMVEQVGWTPGLHDLEREYGIVCYIVSKCYVVKETKDYKSNGSVEEQYYVVCPFEYNYFDMWKRCEPTFNAMSGQCTNSVVVDEIFDSYGEAKIRKDERNNEILLSKKVHLRYDENFHKNRQNIINEFNEKLNYYNQLEEFIEKKTSELKVGKEPKKQIVFMYKAGEIRQINESIYSIMNLYDNTDFRVYIITDEQYNQLAEGNFDVTMNTNLLIINYSKNKVMRLMSLGHKEQFIYDNKLHDSYYGELKRGSNLAPKFYTTETYQDIIDSYQISNEKDNVIKLERKK